MLRFRGNSTYYSTGHPTNPSKDKPEKKACHQPVVKPTYSTLWKPIWLHSLNIKLRLIVSYHLLGQPTQPAYDLFCCSHTQCTTTSQHAGNVRVKHLLL